MQNSTNTLYIKDLPEEELLHLIQTEKRLKGQFSEVCAVVIYLFDVDREDLKEMTIEQIYKPNIPSAHKGYLISFANQKYIVGTDLQLHNLWLDYLESFEEFGEKEIEDDPERFEVLASYDGTEWGIEINETYYFAYRQQ